MNTNAANSCADSVAANISRRPHQETSGEGIALIDLYRSGYMALLALVRLLRFRALTGTHHTHDTRQIIAERPSNT